jgi:hypothetical protein
VPSQKKCVAERWRAKRGDARGYEASMGGGGDGGVNLLFVFVVGGSGRTNGDGGLGLFVARHGRIPSNDPGEYDESNKYVGGVQQRRNSAIGTNDVK